MSSRGFLLLGMLAVGGFFSAFPAAAQLSQAPPDPLARMRAAASGQACTTNEISACAQANPKIVAAALGPSPLADNLRHLEQIGTRVSGTPGMDRAVAWAVAAFYAAGVDAVHTEESAAPGSTAQQENVVAEIRGREKRNEFVVLGAALDSGPPGGSPDNACNAALIVEAARDIHLTGLRPLRSIRFVLFSGTEKGRRSSWSYVNAHRAELDHAIAAVIFDGGCGRLTGFSLSGRQEFEPALREALGFAPIDSWDVGHNTDDASLQADNFDFLLEGVPTLAANRERSSAEGEKVASENLRRSTAVAGVLAFALAEHSTPLGRRQSRTEVEALLERTGLDAQMKSSDLWRAWEGGQRGRQP